MSLLWRIGRRLLDDDPTRALVNSVGASWAVSPRRRVRWLRRWGVAIDEGASVNAGCMFGGNDVHIGAGTFLNVGCVLDNTARIRIGPGCVLGPGAMIVTSTHDQGPSHQRAVGLAGRPVEIEAGCWIGARAILLPGVHVGAGCIIGAGSVVTGDLEPDGVYAGAPARRIRDLG